MKDEDQKRPMTNKIEVGIYEAPGQPPVIVTEVTNFPDGTHGPWVKWRFPWDEKPDTALWFNFEEMLSQGGYTLTPTPRPVPSAKPS